MITEEEYLMMKAKVDRALGRIAMDPEDEGDPGPEEILAGKIMQYCKDRAWPKA